MTTSALHALHCRDVGEDVSKSALTDVITSAGFEGLRVSTSVIQRPSRVRCLTCDAVEDSTRAALAVVFFFPPQQRKVDQRANQSDEATAE